MENTGHRQRGKDMPVSVTRRNENNTSLQKASKFRNLRNDLDVFGVTVAAGLRKFNEAYSCSFLLIFYNQLSQK